VYHQRKIKKKRYKKHLDLIIFDDNASTSGKILRLNAP
jgi:hypothetical protein